MSEKKTRKVHSAEFKAKVGLEALKGVKTINEIGQAYGVYPVQVGQWKKAIQEQAKSLKEIIFLMIIEHPDLQQYFHQEEKNRVSLKIKSNEDLGVNLSVMKFGKPVEFYAHTNFDSGELFSKWFCSVLMATTQYLIFCMLQKISL